MGDQLRLAPVSQEDLPVIQRLTGDPDATGEHAWFGWADPGLYRRRWEETGLLTKDSGVLMVLRGTERLGFVSWHKQPTARTSYCWNIGVAMLPEVRGLGYGTEAQRTLVEYLFAHTQVNRVEAMTEVSNTAEQWALEKAGFTREGVLRGYGFRGGRWRDAVVYSVLRAEIDEQAASPAHEIVTRLDESRRSAKGAQPAG
jgi:RimJ/RimL family protein N-acetyltransferase